MRNADRRIGFTDLADGANTYTPSLGLDNAGIIDELATLLTSGRLSQEKRDLLVSIYDQNGGGVNGLIRAQEVIATSPEFHTNALPRTTNELRPDRTTPQPSTKPYKAVVQILLSGGIDSWNVLVPEVCPGKNPDGETVDEQYRRLRGELALDRAEVQMLIQASNQPCRTFAIHPEAPILQELYDEGALAFLANTGIIDMVDITKDDYQRQSTLFGHNTMMKETKLVDPYRQDRGTGILGRLSEVLTSKGFFTSGISIDNPSDATGVKGEAPDPITVDRFGANEFYVQPQSEESFNLLNYSSTMNARTDLYSSMFGNTWSDEFLKGVDIAQTLNELLETTSVGPQWNGDSKLVQQLSAVSRLMQTRTQRGVDRDMFFFEWGFWDHVRQDMCCCSCGDLEMLFLTQYHVTPLPCPTACEYEVEYAVRY